MQKEQRYMLTINDLFTVSAGEICGAEAKIAILDGGLEIDRLSFTGRVGPGGSGYSRTYIGKPGLAAEIVSGGCRAIFARAAE
jgi:hypothetical protein